jgi:hypothetical protein
MATYLFSKLNNNQVLTFDPALDTLAIDIAGLNAASGTFLQSGADLLLTYNGKTVQLAGVTLARLSGSHVTFANGGKLLIGDDTPGTANDGLANTLIGTARGDYLNGLGGADILAGGDGNDLYVVNNAGDAVIETNTSATQIDTVQSTLANYTLPANVENLRLMGTGHLNGAGNALDNLLYANAGDNVLAGGAGTDTASYRYAAAGVKVSLNTTAAQSTGGSGSDTLAGIENLAGSGYADTLAGNAGHNVLSGGGGADILNGGGGHDTLRIPTMGFKSLDGGNGTDTLLLAGTGLTLDLTALGPKLHNLEAIDLNGANTLSLTAAAVRNLSTTSDQLVVDGTAGSVVNAGGGWTQGPDVAVDLTTGGHTYHTYTQGTAALWVDTAVALNINGAIPLSSLNGTNGFRMDGVMWGDGSGYSVSAAGDVNGDGFADLIIGAFGADPNAKWATGASYVVFGKASGFAAILDLATLNGGNGFRLDGAAGDVSGGSVSGAGDVNGDGFADLLVGAIGADPNGNDGAGSSYVVFGKASGFTATLDLATLNGANGFRLDGEAAWNGSGSSVSAAGDVNGDGLADLIVGAKYGDTNEYGRTDAGSSYVVFGQASGFAATLDLATLNGANGFRLDGAAWGDQSGTSISAAGDVNGDGFADLVIGAPGANPNGKSDAGSSYVVFGKASGFMSRLDLPTLNGANGFRLDGAAAGDMSGRSVSAAGDVNGDGFADLVIGAPGADPNGKTYAGSSYVVFGKATDFGATLALSALNGANGFRLDGVPDGMSAADFPGSGWSVSTAGDVNGDGCADLLVGAPYATPNGAGSSFVVFGKASGFAATLDLSTLNGTNGFRLDGTAVADWSGRSVSAAGDVNGDGFADLVIGANGAAPNGRSDAGSSYVVFGGDFTGAVTKLGTVGDDALTGTAAAERFVAGQGADILTGGGGADVFYGGAGNDTIHVPGLGFQRADGGSGFDTLALDGGGLNLNLANFRNRLDGIERLDLTGGGDNTLTLLARDMLNLSDTGNTLQVDGNAGDHYHLADSGWVPGADVTLVGVTYHAFDNGAAHLLLNAALTAV